MEGLDFRLADRMGEVVRQEIMEGRVTSRLNRPTGMLKVTPASAERENRFSISPNRYPGVIPAKTSDRWKKKEKKPENTSLRNLSGLS